MVDVVNNVIAQQAAAQRSKPQSVAASASVGAAAPRGGGFLSSRIRVDNLQDVVFLEYRSSDGEVVEQYPTQGQIEAFKRAEHLLTQRQSTAQAEQTARYTVKDMGSREAAAPRAPQPRHEAVRTPAPAPATASPSEGARAYSAPAPSGGGAESVFA
jgi:hypothetical protein